MSDKQIYIAFYKGRARKKKGKFLSWVKERFEDAIIRLATFSCYSHCELVILHKDDKYNCFAASPRDNGVRNKIMRLPDDHWDIYPIHGLITYDESIHTPEMLHAFFSRNVGKGYDLIGAIGSVLGIKHDKNKYFCSEFIAEFLGLPKPHTYTPGDLHRLVSKHNQEL